MISISASLIAAAFSFSIRSFSILSESSFFDFDHHHDHHDGVEAHQNQKSLVLLLSKDLIFFKDSGILKSQSIFGDIGAN